MPKFRYLDEFLPAVVHGLGEEEGVAANDKTDEDFDDLRTRIDESVSSLRNDLAQEMTISTYGINNVMLSSGYDNVAALARQNKILSQKRSDYFKTHGTETAKLKQHYQLQKAEATQLDTASQLKNTATVEEPPFINSFGEIQFNTDLS